MKWGYPTYPHSLYWEAVKAEIEKKNKSRKEKQKYYATINRLIKYNFLIRKNKSGREILIFTPKGLIRLQRLNWKNKKKIKLKKRESCLVIFDIPEKMSRVRDLFRRCLYELGFIMFQKSVFISKHDVFNEVKELIQNCGLEEYVKVLITRDV